jgi:cell division septation protein DedD
MSTVVDPDTNEHEAVDLGHDESAAQETLTCPNCGAPADPGQLMCLECGQRLALDYQRPPSWRLPAAVVAVVLLLAGIGVAVALAAVTSDAGKTTAAAPTQTAAAPAPASAPGDTPPTTSTAAPAPTASTPTPAPTTSGTTTTPAPAPTPTTSGWPPGKSGFTVVLASLPTKAAADDRLNAAKAAGITTAAILHSDDFPTLNKGYWVVFDGQYDTVDQAQTQAGTDRGKAGFGDAYPRFVSKDPNAKP